MHHPSARKKVSGESVRTARIPDAGEVCRACASRGDCLMAVLARALPVGIGVPLFHSHLIQPGEHIFFAGDELEFLRVVKSGSVKTYMTSRKGEEHVVTFLMPGDILGADALASGEHESSAVALETTSVCTAPIGHIEYLVERFSPGWLSGLLADEVLREQRTLLMRARKSAQARLAAFLVTLSARFRARGYSACEFELNMPRRDIGNYLGMTIETVSRIFSRMQTEGILEVNRRHVIIRDLDQLNEVADMELVRGRHLRDGRAAADRQGTTVASMLDDRAKASAG